MNLIKRLWRRWRRRQRPPVPLLGVLVLGRSPGGR
jgi:hypothetical protein